MRDLLPATTSPLPAITNVSSIPLTLLPVLGFVLPALFLAGFLLSVFELLFVFVLLFELVSLLSQYGSLLSELVSFAFGIIVRSVMTHKVPSEPSLVSFS